MKTGYERGLRVIDTVVGAGCLLGAVCSLAVVLTTGRPLVAGLCGAMFVVNMSFGTFNLFTGLFGEEGLLKRRLRREIARFRLYRGRRMVSILAIEYMTVPLFFAAVAGAIGGVAKGLGAF